MKADNKTTGLIGGPTGLTGAKTGLIGASSKPESPSKNKLRPSFKELLAKYEKQGATQKKKKQPGGAKDMRSSSKHQEQSVSYPHQGNYIAAHYKPIAPWFILTFIRTSIIVGCICNHITFNILLCIQIMFHHKDQLLLAII